MGGKTQKSEETKRRLKESALRLFNEKDFMGTTVSDITDSAHYAKGTFYLHWETKYDVLLELYRDFLTVFRGIIESSLTMTSDDPFEEIDILIDKAAGVMKDYSNSYKLIHMNEILELLLPKDQVQAEIDRAIAPFAAYIRYYIKIGAFRPVDPEVYGKLLFSIAHNLMESSMLLNYPADVDTSSGELKLLLRKALQNS